MAFDLPGSGNPKRLASTPVRLHFWHVIPFVLCLFIFCYQFLRLELGRFVRRIKDDHIAPLHVQRLVDFCNVDESLGQPVQKALTVVFVRDLTSLKNDGRFHFVSVGDKL